MKANYHPHEYVSIAEQKEPGLCSVTVKLEEAEGLINYLREIDGLAVHSITETSNGRRLLAGCTAGQMKGYLRRWATSWRKARSDVYPPIDVVRVRGKADADVDDILEKNVRAHLRNEIVAGKVISIESDYESSGRLCCAWIMVSPKDRSLDRHLAFDHVAEFEVLD